MKLQLWTALTAGRWRGRRDPVTGEEDEIRSPERKTKSGHRKGRRDPVIRSPEGKKRSGHTVAGEEDEIRSPERKTRSGHRRERRDPVAGEEEDIRSSGCRRGRQDPVIRSPERKTRFGRRRRRRDPVATATPAETKGASQQHSRKGGAFNCRDDEKDETPTTVVTPGGTPTAPTY
jgi:hypothetical protein